MKNKKVEEIEDDVSSIELKEENVIVEKPKK